MQNSKPLSADVVVLCGGLGTRLRSVVSDRPKSIAEINGRTFLEILLDRLFAQRVSRAILCVGYQKEQVVNLVRAVRAEHPTWGEIVFSEEEAPLGTGGAVKNAESRVQSEHFFVVNGDTLSDVALAALRDFHQRKKSIVTITVAPVSGREDAGSIDVGERYRITGFRERAAERARFINAGTYIIERQILGEMPLGFFSLEQDFFPRMVAAHPCFAFIASGDVIDIGTPERYKLAKQSLAEAPFDTRFT